MKPVKINEIYAQIVQCAKTGETIGITKENKLVSIFVMSNNIDDVERGLGIRPPKCEGPKPSCLCSLLGS